MPATDHPADAAPSRAIVPGLTVPVRFTGTDEERAANRATHFFAGFGDPEETPECVDCCARTYHAAADYPCGTEPPRVTIT